MMTSRSFRAAVTSAYDLWLIPMYFALLQTVPVGLSRCRRLSDRDPLTGPSREEPPREQVIQPEAAKRPLAARLRVLGHPRLLNESENVAVEPN
jgi:hypothetical protein